MEKSSIERVIVTVDDEHLEGIDSVAAALRVAGMQVTEILSTVGIISGQAPQECRQKLESVRGVKAVESDGEMRAI
ncbi:MAG: hypothetical protein U1A77_23160 [Pirellulales bacterium]